MADYRRIPQTSTEERISEGQLGYKLVQTAYSPSAELTPNTSSYCGAAEGRRRTHRQRGMGPRDCPKSWKRDTTWTPTTIPRNTYSYYLPPEDYVIPPEVAAEEAAKFRAEIALRAERRKNWPKIEERRRKKLEQIYPSHSEDDGDPPDT